VKLVRSVLVGVLIAASLSGVVRASTPTEPPADPASEPSTTVSSDGLDPTLTSVEVPPPISTPIAASSPLVVVPPGCAAPPAPVAVFVGTLADADATTARFTVQQVRAGSLDGYAVDTIVDVRYDDDIRFLRTGEQYLVGAGLDPILGTLRSKVRSPALLFGGDAVIGIDDTDVRCPRVEDGVKTLLTDGTEVDTGVLTPLKTAKRSVLKAILKPLALAFAVIVLLVSIKLLIFAMVRTVRESAVEDVPIQPDVERARQHTDTEPDPAEELNSR
jgi:hypothetical protein